MTIKNRIKQIDIIKIIKYIFSSGTSFVLDLLLFTVFNYVFKSILISTVLARIISSLYNYLMNSRFVFKSYSKKSICGYYLLVIIQIFVSSGSVTIISNMLPSINDTIIKFFVDIVIFIVNYFIQKRVIFK